MNQAIFKVCSILWQRLLFKMLFIQKYIKIIYFYILKFIIDFSIPKQLKNKKIILNKINKF